MSDSVSKAKVEQTPTNVVREQHALTASRQLNAGEEHCYRLWQTYASPYSNKVMAYLNYKGIPYKRITANMENMMGEIAERVGKPIVPVIITPDNQVLQDSTPMLEWFESQYPHNSAIPDDNRLAFIMWLVEEFADEYMRRIHMHTRWGNELNRSAISHRLARTLTYAMDGVNPKDIAPFMLERQSGFNGDLGLTTPEVRASVERQMHDLLAIFEEHFLHYQFVLGGRPSLADFALYGSLNGHLFNDPFSAEILEVYAPRTCRWLDTISELGDTRGHVGQTEFGDWIDLEQKTPSTVQQLLAFIGKTYIPLAKATAAAEAQQQDLFEVSIYGQTATFNAYPYRVWSFEQLQNRYLSLADSDRDFVCTLLTKAQVLPAMMADPIHHNNLYDGFTPPFIREGVCDALVKQAKSQNQ
ncbi:hypothetical protein R50073_16150 [Maricurvus nonylphenolicus]|uniref:glutathione S-transferase family protein n=1 Tax=Maricurvus nonylphenolicus TaxID=1008307 RepID=UPI0036F43794